MAKVKVGDYNRDGVVDAADSALAPADTDNDGRISPKEQAAYDKANPAPTAESYGVNDAYLEAHPDIKVLIAQAIAGRWDSKKFLAEFEKTPTGQATTDAEVAFDVGIAGPRSEDLQVKIKETSDALRNQAMELGVSLTEDQIAQYAKNVVRSGLTTQDILGFMSQNVQTGQPAKERTGQVADIVDSLQSMANDYGVTLTPDYIQQKAQEAVKLGGNWQTYLDSQRNVFRDQAKLLYPTVADKLDKYSLKDMLDPYLADASQLLGINRENMNLNDTMWTTPLNGENGPMNRDQWIATMRTDPRYGYDKTTKARNEYMNLANNILSVFGMA